MQKRFFGGPDEKKKAKLPNFARRGGRVTMNELQVVKRHK